MRAVIYARHSSQNQREASIEDQVRLCREFIRAQGWSYLHAYTDRAISGASPIRAGYQKLLEDARAGEFDVVVAEALAPRAPVPAAGVARSASALSTPV